MRLFRIPRGVGPRFSALVFACLCAAASLAFAEPAERVVDESALRLGRAALEHLSGQSRAVVENLEAIDFESPSTFGEADRAAFLLGHAYLELGSRAEFERLAATVAHWKRDTPYTRWIAFRRAALASTSASAEAPPETGDAAADALAAGLVLRSGDTTGALARLSRLDGAGATPLSLYLKAVTLEASNADASDAWARLAATDTLSALGRDLAGAAHLRLATRAAERGEDPSAHLLAVPSALRVS
ncbi:MAG: hypothetical protein HOP12_02035, partial [Candidatus Eisenbacteria bacterium]|nr:hypothetical protein [Candidatus Eisenbacteria bacterium]